MLHIHRSERASALAAALSGALARPLADPFASEVVSVPTRGMERWLTQQMSTRLGSSPGRRDGVCANIAFPFPRTLVGDALALAGGVEAEADPWLPERSVWPLLSTVDECLGERWLATLATHLRRSAERIENRRLASVIHLAELYDRYGVRRPEMIRAWAGGSDSDGAGRRLPEDGAWQAELWRRLRARIGAPSPAERLTGACEQIRAQPALLALPERISLFGVTRLPASYVDVLAAISAHRDVHVLVLHPSPALWRAVAERTCPAPATRSRRHDVTAALPRNRLLASWGQDARELQLVLARPGEQTEHEDHHHPSDAAGAPGATLLARLQADIREDRAAPGAPLADEPDARPPLDPEDRSLQIHACHGRARQVEVIRDAILHLLARDPTLEPRDVIVMCPDVETMAPLIQASFGAGRVEPEVQDGEPVPGQRQLPDLRVRLADRSIRQTNPVLGAVAQLLELADQRATASQLLDLADREPVRRRFRFDDEDVVRMQEWVVASGIRWGLDATHREPFKLDVVGANTWRSGLDRILLGVAMTEDDRRLVGDVLPLDDVESGAIDLAGRMAELVDRFHQAVDALARPQPIEAWAEAIACAADLLTATSPADSWQRSQLGRILDEVVGAAAGDPGVSGSPGTGPGRDSPALELADVRALLADRLRGRPTRANFRTGHLTICTLVPMRSVPHRVVCLLGLDDGEFPRKAARDGDDLLLGDPQLGDRDPRAEDRQMLLDALMAATERLIITYTGNDERTNLPRPPAVPVAELIDVVERTVRPAGAEQGVLEQVVVHHPLQPFDPRNFTDGAVVPGTAWSFDRTSLEGARALSGPRPWPAPFLGAPLPPPATALIELERLVRFVEHPARAFLRTRLGISVRESSDDVEDALPVELGGLGEWQVGQRLLEGLVAGDSIEDCVRAELARGSLPPGMLAEPVLERIRPVVERLAAAAAAYGVGASRSLDVNLRLADGRTLAGTVPGVFEDTLLRVSYSRVRPRDRLAAWVRLLALSVARPEGGFNAAVIGRARSKHASVAVTQIGRLGPEEALSHLTALVDLYDRGMREPLPLACESSAAYAEAAARGEDAPAAAQAAWQTTFGWDREDRQPEHLLVNGGALSFAALIDEPPREDEHGQGWSEAESRRFGRYARRLWDPLLASERVHER